MKTNALLLVFEHIFHKSNLDEVIWWEKKHPQLWICFMHLHDSGINQIHLFLIILNKHIIVHGTLSEVVPIYHFCSPHWSALAFWKKTSDYYRDECAIYCPTWTSEYCWIEESDMSTALSRSLSICLSHCLPLLLTQIFLCSCFPFHVWRCSIILKALW